MRLAIVLGSLLLGSLQLLGACGANASDGLSGSLTSRLDLSYDRVRVLGFGEDLSVEYVRDVAGGVLIPFKLVARGAAAESPTGAPSAGRDIGTEALSVARVMGAGDPSALPALEFGSLTLDDRIEVGAPLSGAFDLRFTDGSDLSGHFEATVEGP